MLPHQRLSLLLIVVFLLVSLPIASAQLGGLTDRIRDRVENDVERRIEERAVEAARASLDLAEDAIVCAATDNECIDEARGSGVEPVIVNQDGEPVSGYEPAGADNSGPDPEVWANYEFIPGERVLFLHDFEGTAFRGYSFSSEDEWDEHLRYITSSPFAFRSYLSSSTSENIARDFMRRHPCKVLLTIRSRRGKEISKYSVFPLEQEVLFGQRTVFRTISSSRQGTPFTLQLRSYETNHC